MHSTQAANTPTGGMSARASEAQHAAHVRSLSPSLFLTVFCLDPVASIRMHGMNLTLHEYASLRRTMRVKE